MFLNQSYNYAIRVSTIGPDGKKHVATNEIQVPGCMQKRELERYVANARDKLRRRLRKEIKRLLKEGQEPDYVITLNQ